MLDFRIFCSVVSQLGGGVYMNLGSAVVMPEVFLKAVAVVRNFGHDLDELVTVNFDKESKYRTGMNVLRRPGSEGIEIIGIRTMNFDVTIHEHVGSRPAAV